MTVGPCSDCCGECWQCYHFYSQWYCFNDPVIRCNCGENEDGTQALFNLRNTFEFWFEIDEESFTQTTRSAFGGVLPDATEEVLGVVENFKRQLSNGYTWVALPSVGGQGSSLSLSTQESNDERATYVPAGTNVRPEDASDDWVYGAQTGVYGSGAGYRSTIATSFAKSCLTRFGSASQFSGIGFDGYTYDPDGIFGGHRLGYGFILYPNYTMHLGAVIVTNTGEGLNGSTYREFVNDDGSVTPRPSQSNNWRPGEPLGYVCSMKGYPHVYTQKCQLILEGYTERDATPEDYYSVGGKVTEYYQFLMDGVLKFKSMYDFYDSMPDPTGACCEPSGNCTVTTEVLCRDKCGSWTYGADCQNLEDSNQTVCGPPREPDYRECYDSFPSDGDGTWTHQPTPCHDSKIRCNMTTCNPWDYEYEPPEFLSHCRYTYTVDRIVRLQQETACVTEGDIVHTFHFASERNTVDDITTRNDIAEGYRKFMLSTLTDITCVEEITPQPYSNWPPPPGGEWVTHWSNPWTCDSNAGGCDYGYIPQFPPRMHGRAYYYDPAVGQELWKCKYFYNGQSSYDTWSATEPSATAFEFCKSCFEDPPPGLEESVNPFR